LQDGDVPAALEDAKLASHQDDKDLSVLYIYGAAMVAAKDYAGAGAAFDRLATLDGSSPYAAYGRARLLLAQGDRPGAIRQLETVLGLAPKQREAVATDSAFRRAARRSRVREELRWPGPAGALALERRLTTCAPSSPSSSPPPGF